MNCIYTILYVNFYDMNDTFKLRISARTLATETDNILSHFLSKVLSKHLCTVRVYINCTNLYIKISNS